MTTAVDTSILVDVLGADPTFGDASRAALKAAYDAGSVVACDVVWAEVAAWLPKEVEVLEALGPLGIAFDPVPANGAQLAGRRWGAFRKSGGSRRERVVADFLIGAHAQLSADALLTRDRGFYRLAFKGLKVISPAASSSSR